MKVVNRSIFRADAVRRYTQSREESVLPPFVSPRTFTYLWILLGLFGVSGFVAWCARVPVYASGLGVVVDRRGKTNDVGDDVVVVAFLRPENHSRLRVGQTLLVQLDPAGERTRRPIIAIEPKIVSGFVINGEPQNNSSGSSVSGVGDVNGDGLDDLIIGTSSAKKS